MQMRENKKVRLGLSGSFWAVNLRFIFIIFSLLWKILTKCPNAQKEKTHTEEKTA